MGKETCCSATAANHSLAPICPAVSFRTLYSVGHREGNPAALFHMAFLRGSMIDPNIAKMARRTFACVCVYAHTVCLALSGRIEYMR
jgi:hypothetical protein